MAARECSRLWHVYHERYDISAGHIGGAGWRYRGRADLVRPGVCMLMEPGETHRNTAIHRPATFKVVSIDVEVLRTHAERLGVAGTPHFRSMQTIDPRLFGSLYKFCASVESSAGALEQQSHFATFARLLLAHTERPPLPHREREQQGWKRAKAYLQDRFNEPVGLNELAAVARLSPYHLTRNFTAHAGLPPHAYQIHVRIERAAALLRAGVSPTEAAAQVGFADQSHFTRHFKRIWGVTPGVYARAR